MTANEESGGAKSRWLPDRPDEFILRWVLRALVAATISVVALDYQVLDAALKERDALPRETPAPEPLPPAKRSRESAPKLPGRIPNAKLREAMSFELAANGRLLATGTITPGIARAFAEEVDKRGSYVKTVVLHSPGGSVQDALSMGRLIREKGFATEVAAGDYCASSCPLVFAGGVQRTAGKGAAIGVHQIYAFDDASSGTGMAGAQHVSALCQKHLRDMGVDLGLWIHAMETPKEQLYYFKPAELISLKLATTADGSRPPVSTKN